MRKYTVLFYYGSDLRCEWTGEALDEVRALAKAMDHHNISTWATQEAFTIEITSA